jgi:hypothetical protein
VAHGGQVVASVEFLRALSAEKLNAAVGAGPPPSVAVATSTSSLASLSPIAVTHFGAFTLRGLSEPLELVQLSDECLAARVFPPLRIEGGNHDGNATTADETAAKQEDGGDSVLRTDDRFAISDAAVPHGAVHSDSDSVLSTSFTNTAAAATGGVGRSPLFSHPSNIPEETVVLCLLSPLPVDARIQTLKRLMLSWRVAWHASSLESFSTDKSSSTSGSGDNAPVRELQYNARRMGKRLREVIAHYDHAATAWMSTSQHMMNTSGGASLLTSPPLFGMSGTAVAPAAQQAWTKI